MKKFKIRILTFLLSGFIVLVIILAYNTLRLKARQFPFDKEPPVKKSGVLAFSSNDLAQKLSELIKIKTISSRSELSKDDKQAFARFHRLLAEMFPQLHKTLETKVINQYSLLYTWKGSDPALKPLLLMAHFDVVPVEYEQGQKKIWRYPPFAGKIDKGFVWGRGALDDKSALLCMMAAVESLLGSGYQPRRSIILAIAHDEEVGGVQGAKKIVEELRKSGIQPQVILDEWSPVIAAGLLGIKNPVALIGVAEKGYMTLRLTATDQSGHSSKPKKETAIVQLARAITAIESNPLPVVYQAPTKQMLETLAPHAPMKLRMAIANIWLFRSPVMGVLAGKPETNALIRTTLVTTVVKAGIQENVIPYRASSLVNIRLLPGQSSESVIKHVKTIIANKRIKLETKGPVYEASTVSSMVSNNYLRIAKSIRQSFPKAVIAPSLMIGATDSRHYQVLNAPVYRFRPFKLKLTDTYGIHGVNEKISVSSLAQGARFYMQLIGNFDK